MDLFTALVCSIWTHRGPFYSPKGSHSRCPFPFKEDPNLGKTVTVAGGPDCSVLVVASE
jgi:hypothetical protein